MDEERLNETVSLLEGQCGKLKEIHGQYMTAYDAAFNRGVAIEAVSRWFQRTQKIIESRVSPSEGNKFRRLLAPAPRIRGSWEFGEWLGQLNTFIAALVEDIKANPDDPAYDRLLAAPVVTNLNKASYREAEPTQYDVFLSYQIGDKDQAREIYEALQQAGRACFLAEKTLKPGDNFTEVIREALNGTKELWLLVSPDSVESEWVQNEYSAAWALKKKIIPILFRCGPDKLPKLLSQTQAIDYHNFHSLIPRPK